jgi:hypothetical protein
VRLIPWGVESEAVGLVLPTKPTLRERSPNYLDPSLWGVESDAVSLPYEKITESDPALWGVRATSRASCSPSSLPYEKTTHPHVMP